MSVCMFGLRPQFLPSTCWEAVPCHVSLLHCFIKVKTQEDPERENPSQMEAGVSYNLIMEAGVSYNHHFSCTVFIRSKSVGLVHTQGERIK